MKYALIFIITAALCTGCLSVETNEESTTESVRKTYISPLNGYSQIVSVSQNGVTTLYVSGQIGEGDNLEQQMRAALDNMQTHLAEAGATLDDLVKITTFIVDYEPADLDTFRQVRREIMGNEDMPASTLVGVEALGLPAWQIEIEGVAVIPSTR